MLLVVMLAFSEHFHDGNFLADVFHRIANKHCIVDVKKTDQVFLFVSA